MPNPARACAIDVAPAPPAWLVLAVQHVLVMYAGAVAVGLNLWFNGPGHTVRAEPLHEEPGL